MNHCLSALGGTPTEATQRRNHVIGAIFEIASRSRSHTQVPLHAMMERLRPALDLGQYRLYYNVVGQCLGFVTWAFLTPVVEQRLIGSADTTLYDFEWNEGGCAWIVDFLVPTGAVREVMRDLHDTVLKDYAAVTYFRYRNGRRLCKRIRRDACSAFFRYA